MTKNRSNAFELLDNFIQTGRLCRFIDCFFEELAEEQAWKLWLHKETGKTWGDFKLSVIPQDTDVEGLVDNTVKIQNMLAEGG